MLFERLAFGDTPHNDREALPLIFSCLQSYCISSLGRLERILPNELWLVEEETDDASGEGRNNTPKGSQVLADKPSIVLGGFTSPLLALEGFVELSSALREGAWLSRLRLSVQNPRPFSTRYLVFHLIFVHRILDCAQSHGI